MLNDELRRDPLVNIMFLTKVKETDIGRILIENCLNHGMPFREVGSFIMDIVEAVKKEMQNDPEQRLLDAIMNEGKNNYEK